MHAWLFYFALVLFPLWWIGAVWRVPQTRLVGGTDTEKAVPLDDPQIEFGTSLFFLSFLRQVLMDHMRCMQTHGRGDFAAVLWPSSRCLHTSPSSFALPYLRVIGDKTPPLAPPVDPVLPFQPRLFFI